MEIVQNCRSMPRGQSGSVVRSGVSGHMMLARCWHGRSSCDLVMSWLARTWRWFCGCLTQIAMSGNATMHQRDIGRQFIFLPSFPARSGTAGHPRGNSNHEPAPNIASRGCVHTLLSAAISASLSVKSKMSRSDARCEAFVLAVTGTIPCWVTHLRATCADDLPWALPIETTVGFVSTSTLVSPPSGLYAL